MKSDREILKKDGWLHLKNFFTADEVKKLRAECNASTQEELYNVDLLSNQHLQHLFANEKLINLLVELLGDKPVYFGDSSYQVASIEGGISNGFHKDCIDRKNPNGKDWQDDYSLIRIGIYLQDHSQHSEGLVIRNQSHRTVDLQYGKKINVPSQPGDLLVWYLTTTHSGNAKRLKTNYPVVMGGKTGGNWISRKAYEYLPAFCFKPSEQDRVAIFATFGKSDNHLERYLKYLQRRAYMVNIWRKNQYPIDTCRQINKLSIIDMKSTADNINLNNFTEFNFNESLE